MRQGLELELTARRMSLRLRCRSMLVRMASSRPWGDLMARWTNDRWVSTLHRVVNPPPDMAYLNRRQSLVFFHHANYDAVIECIPSCQDPDHPIQYPVITSGEVKPPRATSEVATPAPWPS